MRIKDIIIEGRNTNLVVVDVQPAYRATYYAEKIIDFAEKQTGKIVAFYNSEEFSNDTLQDVMMFWQENGARDNLLERVFWTEKTYAFLRAWMDLGVPDSTIIKVIRYLATNKLNDSRDIGEDDPNFDLQDLIGTENYEPWMEDDPIYIPDISIANLKNLSPFYLCGGARSECLREVELLCNAFNIKYKRINSLIYPS